MERVRRRFWTLAITATAVAVIAAAFVSGLFQLVVQAVPGYRDDVERYVREVTGRAVRIESLGLTWRRYYPTLELIGVALLAEDGDTPLLQAERLRLGFGLVRLLGGDLTPQRLELHGLAIDARIDRDGEVTVKGIEGAGATEPGERLEALGPLTRFDHVRLERCRVNVRDDRRRGQTYSFGILQAELDRGLLGTEFELDVALPASLGDAAHLEGAFTGELLEPATWSGRGAVEGTGLVVGTWLAPYLVRGASVEVTGAEARVEAKLESGNFTAMDWHVKTGPVRAHRARHEAALESFEARVVVGMLADGWKAEVRHLGIESTASRWPATTGEVRATTAAGMPTLYEARAEYLRLGDLTPWLRMLPVPAGVAALDKAHGDVRDLQLRVQGAGEDLRFSYRARFDELAVPAAERPAGFAGVRGEVAGDERGGRAVLQESPVSLELPGMLITPTVPLEAFEAELEWRKLDDGWQIGMPQFRWELWTTRGKGRFELMLPARDDRGPVLDLTAQFSAEDATRAKTLMPQRWGTGLTTWLDRSIVAGGAPRAELVIKGPLADFPFEDKPTGRFELDIEAAGVLLEYQPDWPPVEDLKARLKFRGNSLAIAATEGTVSGNPLKTATARFPNFRTGQLLVDGTVAGETAKFYDFLARSPLKDKFRGLLGQTTAAGRAAVDIKLDIPVTHAADTQTGGRVALEGVELRHGGLPEPIRDIRGIIAFGGTRVSSEKITGKLYELPLEATLTPQGDGSTLLNAGFQLTVDPAGKGASSLIPAWVRSKVRGTSQWRGVLALGTALNQPVTLTTDLTGVRVNLPPPLGKPAEQPIPLTLTIGGAAGVPLHITADYAQRFGADLRFARARQGLVLDRGTLRLGGGALTPPEEKGLVLVGDFAELDARAWARELQGAGLEAQIQWIKRADLHLGRTVWDRWAVRDARYQWTSQKNGWALTLSGSGGAGEVRWSGGAQPGQLTAHLEQLALDFTPTPPADTDEPPSDPTKLPLIDLDVQRLTIGASNLGHATLVSARTEAGQKLKTLEVEGGTATLSGEGEWRRRAGQSSATFNAELTTSDIAGLLRTFGYTPNIDAKLGRFAGTMAWAPTDKGIEWQHAQGAVRLEFENGQLRAVEPGAGRVLGLVNFYALPRRLTLNFRDVLGSGLGFDKIEGDFELRDGNARTENLRIAGPSLNMDVRGRIGLAARDYDQQVTVYPDVSAGVTLGALALGGPVAGALALIAQEVLNKPLNQVTQLSYRVTGSWDNPQVERAPGAPGRERQTGPPSQKP
jgi:uncharacterized protein (TIGR02099 family)